MWKYVKESSLFSLHWSNDLISRHIPSLHTKTHASSHVHHIFSYQRLYFFSSGGFVFLCALTPYCSIRGGEWHEPRMLSGTLATNMPKRGTRTPYKSKVSFRSLSSQVLRTSWYSQGSRPRHLARPGGLGKDQDHQQDQVFWQDHDQPWYNPTASNCRKMSYHVKYMIPQINQFNSSYF